MRLIEEQPSDGVLLLSTEPENILPFQELHRPMVLLGNWPEQTDFDCVAVDNRKGIVCAVKHLRDLGHTHIGYLISTEGSRTFAGRRNVYHQVMKSCFSQEQFTTTIIPVNPTLEGSYQNMFEYLSYEPVLPTAFLADSDQIAAGCMLALQQAGLNVPGQISMIGLGKLSLRKFTNPPLTTVALPKEELGNRALELLKQQLRHIQPAAPRRVLVSPALFCRSSTAKALAHPIKYCWAFPEKNYF